MRAQCKLLGIARSTVSYVPVADCAEDVRLKRRLDELYLRDPCLGSRRLVTVLERDENININRKRLQRLRRDMGIAAIYCKPRTSVPDKTHRIYPYLLRDLDVTKPDQVWCADITYVPMLHGNAYLCSIMDWYSRRELGSSVSNTMDVALCLSALNKAKALAGCAPDIFNTDQGSQFTSDEWTNTLEGWGVRISMDGRGRWMDNVFIERLWRSIKYEDIYLREYRSVAELAMGVERWMAHYNTWRPHQALGNLTPAEVYRPVAKRASKGKEAKSAA